MGKYRRNWNKLLYGTKWLKTKLKKNTKMYFAETNGRFDAVYSGNMVKCIANDKWYESRKSDKINEAERIITAAKIITAKIRELISDDLVYPTHDDIVLPEKQDSFSPSSLRKFLKVLIRPKN